MAASNINVPSHLASGEKIDTSNLINSGRKGPRSNLRNLKTFKFTHKPKLVKNTTPRVLNF